MSNASLKSKRTKMLEGNHVVITREELESLEAMPMWQYLASLPNPGQLGTLDEFVAYYKRGVDHSPACLCERCVA